MRVYKISGRLASVVIPCERETEYPGQSPDACEAAASHIIDGRHYCRDCAGRLALEHLEKQGD